MTDDARDLDDVARLRADVPPPTAAALADARERLLNQDVRPAVLIPRHRRRADHARRRVLVGLSAAAVVAAVAGGAFALTGNDEPRPQAAPSGPSSPPSSTSPSTPSSTPSSSPAPVHFVNAAQVLDAATANARRTPVPAAGQYLHVREHSYSITQVDEPPAQGAYELSESRYESWQPATAGTGYLRNDNYIAVDYPTKRQRAYAESSPGGIPKRQVTWYETAPDGTSKQVYPRVEEQPGSGPCTDCDTSVWEDTDADTSSLPRDPDQLRAQLYRWAKKNYRELVEYGKGDQFTVDDLAYRGAATVVTRSDVPGELRAELYQVIKTIPGIKLIGSLANYDGRKGIAVGRVDTFHVQYDLIFADNGSTYIGDRSIARKPSREYDVKAGTLVGANAVTVDVTGKPDVPGR